ncbi:MAG: DUF3089 domain-containing protein, partial [Eubacterium sp.]
KKENNHQVDVFFIHPTTYLAFNSEFSKVMIDRNAENRFLASLNDDPMNAEISDKKLNIFTDQSTIKNQASVFNDACRIFAPRYRQAHVKVFFFKENEAVKNALDLAYSDVRRAFKYYLTYENQGRPIIIAGHSQGTFHGLRLLREFFDGTALQKQLVYACLPGFQIKHHYFKVLPFLKTPEAIGGFLGWRSYQRGVVPEDLPDEQGDSLCINPLTWTDTMKKVTAEEPCGIEDFSHPLICGIQTTIEPNTKTLLVDLPKEAPLKMRIHQNLHLYDYSLFWLSIRKNIKQRIDAYQNKI